MRSKSLVKDLVYEKPFGFLVFSLISYSYFCSFLKHFRIHISLHLKFLYFIGIYLVALYLTHDLVTIIFKWFIIIKNFTCQTGVARD